MRLRLRLAFLTFTVLAAMPALATAQPVTGPYISGAGGLNYREDQGIHSSVSTLVPGGSAGTNVAYGQGQAAIRTDLGYGFLGAAGWGLGNGWRFEVEGSYRDNSVSSRVGSLGGGTRDGDTQTYAVMANTAFDMDIGLNWLYPYVGAGAGYAWSKMRVQVPGESYDSIEGTAGNFAYQAFAGLSFPIAPVPGLSLTAEYRFFGTLSPNRYDDGDRPGVTAPLPSSAKLGEDFNHSGLVGLRYAFNTAPPPVGVPEPVPAAAPSRSYLVFFDWDRADLTVRARQIIREAADNSTRVQYTRIEVDGYTDTSGTQQYNQGLSMRRAQAVAAELVKDGVPRQSITIMGFGDTHLLVPTGPGVREPQNRRVEIIIK
jgi:outer membrane protein OmpA-like peptidoglycan-associated protein